MASFELNNVRETAAAETPLDHQGSGSKGDALAAVKSVKRLSAYPWPFSVKISVDQRSADYQRLSQFPSSFVT